MNEHPKHLAGSSYTQAINIYQAFTVMKDKLWTTQSWDVCHILIPHSNSPGSLKSRVIWSWVWTELGTSREETWQSILCPSWASGCGVTGCWTMARKAIPASRTSQSWGLHGRLVYPRATQWKLEMVVIFPKRWTSEIVQFRLAHLQPTGEPCGVPKVTPRWSILHDHPTPSLYARLLM